MFFKIIFIFLFIFNFAFSNEMKEEQIKVAYTYNFLQNISWENENNFKNYRILIVSKNETLKNMFKMLGSRKSLKNKNIEVLFYKENSIIPNIQAIFIDHDSKDIFENLFYKYEKENTLLISDSYENQKQVMINLIHKDKKIDFEINKANILNRNLNLSSNIILLGGTEIDVAKLYKSSQDELRKQKDTINDLSQNIVLKNQEIESKANEISIQQNKINNQNLSIKNKEDLIKKQEKQINAQLAELESKKQQLDTIFNNIEIEKKKLEIASKEAKLKEEQIKELENAQKNHEKTLFESKKELDELFIKIDEQRNSILIHEKTIELQKLSIIIVLILLTIILFLGINGIRQNLKLKNFSETDSLSNLYNRRYANNILEKEIKKFNRYKNIFSVILIDIDFFKNINDNFGHDKGDFVIKEISKIFSTYSRDSDICSRWGGEEFLIIATNTNSKQAFSFAENLRKIIENYDFKLEQKITISIGISTIKENQNQTELLKLADNALYQAKTLGRNQTIVI